MSRKALKQEVIGEWWVSTVRLSVEHHGGTWFETYVFPAQGGEVPSSWSEVYGERYVTEDEGRAGHERIAAGVRDGSLVEEFVT